MAMAKASEKSNTLRKKTQQCLHLHFHLIFLWPVALCTESIFLTPFPIYYWETAGRKGKYRLECSLCRLTDCALHKNSDEIAVCFLFPVFILSEKVMMIVWCGWGVLVDTHLFSPNSTSCLALFQNTNHAFLAEKLHFSIKFTACSLFSHRLHPGLDSMCLLKFSWSKPVVQIYIKGCETSVNYPSATDEFAH